MTETLFSSLDSSSTIVNVFMERPSKYMMLLSFAQEILREDSFLPKQDRELVATFTSNLNGCKFCTGSHKVFALSVGSLANEIDAALSDSYAGHRLESILDYVKKLTLAPSSITKADVEKVIAAGFSEDELKDAIAVCAAFNLFNRIVEGHGIHENSESWIPSADDINKFGYDRRYFKA
jgi:uncharacterized peroxidase-related enzyme